MIIISETESYSANKPHIDSFIKLYNANFPDSNEREDFEIISSRILKKTYFDDSKTFLIIHENSGLVTEYYHSCGSLLLTYIVVDDASRGKGIATHILSTGIERIIELVKVNSGKEVNAVFLEVNHPCKTEIDSFDPDLRLKIFRNIGAKLVDIPYVQPSLGKKKAKVRNLFLLCLPLQGHSKSFIELCTIKNFLTAFYIDLGITRPDDDADFRLMNSQLDALGSDGLFFLNEIPVTYNSVYSFKRSAISFHLPCIAKNTLNFTCNFIHSYELDLFSYQNQGNTPFRSKCLKPHSPVKVQLIFPENIVFTSEGRKETLLINRRTVEAYIYPLFTRFHTGEGVATLTFKPIGFFSEIDIISLTSLFGSNQEQSNLIDSLRFRLEGEDHTLIKVFKFFFKEYTNFEDDYSHTTGSVSIDISSLKDDILNIEIEKIYEYFHGIENNEADAAIGLQKEYKRSKETQYFLNVICGIAQGIFDFNRMGINEVLDTLIPVNSSSNSFQLCNRGCIAEVCQSDIFDENSEEPIGTSPYLIIPNILLSHMEFCLHLARKEIDKSSRKENKDIKRIEDILSRSAEQRSHIRQDVFQYPSEKNLIEIGHAQRNIKLSEDILTKRREETIKLLSRLHNDRNNRFDTVKAFALIVLTVLQSQNILKLMVRWQITDKIENEDLLSVALMTLFSLIAIVIYFFRKRVRKTIASDE